MEPLLTNERAQREWQYIIERVGEQAARAAIERLPGNRRPYPLNIARVLNLQLPPELATAPASKEAARAHIAKLREMLRGR
ncbi:MAG: cryptic plasmid protein A [Fimbriimonadales bacterium]|nr:cryptic plasmid protein A [Fimbriimonadales bacterium]